MPTYLLDAQEGTPLYEIHRAWNAGLDKEEVTVRLIRRFGDRHDDLLDVTWEKLEAEFGEGCMPICRPNPVALGERLSSNCPIARADREFYERWKGISGPGAQLREMALAMREASA